MKTRTRIVLVSVTATEDGLHILRIEDEETRGGFDVAWSVKESVR